MAEKRKRMTKWEKALNAGIKKELQEQGVLPPDKPRLNRKKYVAEAMEEWNGKDKDFHAWEFYLYKAISIMLGKTERDLRISQEAVGVAKCLKLALRLKKFHDKLNDEGRTEYKLGEEWEFIKDIVDA